MAERRSPKPNVEGSSPSWPVYKMRGRYVKNNYFWKGVCRRAT